MLVIIGVLQMNAFVALAAFKRAIRLIFPIMIAFCFLVQLTCNNGINRNQYKKSEKIYKYHINNPIVVFALAIAKTVPIDMVLGNQQVRIFCNIVL